MAGKVKPIPDGHHGALPYLICKGTAETIEFYKRAFGATEINRMMGPGGSVTHAELKLGEAIIMLAEECADMKSRSPRTLGGSPMSIYMYVNDVDAFARRAIDAGAKVLYPLGDQFWGDRTVAFEDPSGFTWCFATHIEDVSPEETQRRAAAKFGGCD